MKTEGAIALRGDHPMMVAWKAFCETEEFKNALKWSMAIRYPGGRDIDDEYRMLHIKGALWLAFTKGMEQNHE